MFSSLVEKTSNPQLCVLGRLFIIIFILYSYNVVKCKIQFTTLFRLTLYSCCTL